jgi:hypothetical protein
MVTHREKCIKSPVQIVEKKQKFPLNQMVLDQFTARTAIRSIDHQGDFKSLLFFLFSHLIHTKKPSSLKTVPLLFHHSIK